MRSFIVMLLALLCSVAAAHASERHEEDRVTLELPHGHNKPWTGNLDAMVERRLVRVLVVPSKTNYFYDGPRARGVTAELVAAFEKHLNKQLKTGRVPVRVAFVPVRRDQLLPFLEQGLGDIAAAALTITEKGEAEVDFSSPFVSGIHELVVTGPGGPQLATLDDLAGKEVFVRASSGYDESLQTLNADFATRGLAPVAIVAVDENLEDEDILEMVAAGLIGTTVVDGYLAGFWSQVFDKLVVHRDLALRSDGEIAWALRKESPKLKALIDDFFKTAHKGTQFGNILLQRYFKSARYLQNALHSKEWQKVDSLGGYFQTYAAQYGFDWLQMLAQGYQESQLEQSVVSRVGAIGIMQVLPATAADPAIGIADISHPEPNIHAGIKYMAILRDNYLNDPALDDFNRMLFALAAYNAGPNRIVHLRAKAAKTGYDPNIWFQNVEYVVARSVGRETVRYVSNIHKYYVAYQLALVRRDVGGDAGQASEQKQ